VCVQYTQTCTTVDSQGGHGEHAQRLPHDGIEVDELLHCLVARRRAQCRRVDLVEEFLLHARVCRQEVRAAIDRSSVIGYASQ